MTSQNVFVGGENKWAYNTFTNWEFWWPGFPVIAYFKVSVPSPAVALSSRYEPDANDKFEWVGAPQGKLARAMLVRSSQTLAACSRQRTDVSCWATTQTPMLLTGVRPR